MQTIRSRFSVTMLAILVMIGGYMLGRPLLDRVEFARAEQQVDLTRQQLSTVQDLSTVFRQVGKVVEPSVVKINVTKVIHNTRQNSPMQDDQIRRWLREHGAPEDMIPFDDGQGGDMQEIGTGSGFILDAADGYGYILTNNHVAGDASSLKVVLADGRTLTGKLLGADAKSDLAVVQIKADRLIAAKWGNSDELEKGDWIMAFGSPFGYVGSMTHGIVSALNRHDVGIPDSRDAYENFIQVDAPINPGNSGGPLVNIHGEVVGINTAIATRSGGFQGIGFAIPSNQAKPIYEQLKSNHKVVRGWLGISIRDVSANLSLAKSFGYTGDTGILVEQTFPNTPAYGKLEEGDIVTGLNGQGMTEMQQLRNTVAAIAPGTEITLKVFRSGKTQDVKVTVGDQPEDVAAALTHDRGLGGEESSADNSVTQALGLTLATLDKDTAQRMGLNESTGAVITAVAKDSLAAQAGLAVGDVIKRVGDQKITTAEQAAAALKKVDLATGVRLRVASKEGSRFVFLQKTADDANP